MITSVHAAQFGVDISALWLMKSLVTEIGRKINLI